MAIFQPRYWELRVRRKRRILWISGVKVRAEAAEQQQSGKLCQGVSLSFNRIGQQNYLLMFLSNLKMLRLRCLLGTRQEVKNKQVSWLISR